MNQRLLCSVATYQYAVFRYVLILAGFLIWLSMTRSALSQNISTARSTDLPAYSDTSQPIDARVADLLSRMTLEEKASQLVNQSRAIPRLGIPKYDWRSEALHGIAGAGIATVFPEPIGLAATFDDDLIHHLGTAVGEEGRAKHNIAVRLGRRDILEGLDFWAPNINIARDPRWGRVQETYGEDPYLTSRMAVAYVTGMQGDDADYLRVIATPKHFAVHSGPETTRHVMNVEVSKHDMQDTYLPAFRAAIVEGKAASVMCAYNRVNSQPACANQYLLGKLLREAWGFRGYVVGDCDAVDEIFSEHHYVNSVAEAAALALRRGTDNECIDSYSEVNDRSDYQRYLDAIAQGRLSESDVDTAVKRLLTARFQLGEFDPPERVRYARTPDSVIDSAEHRALALRAARESMVLLKNDGVLPVSHSVKRIAVVGPSADSTRVLLGNYNGTPSHATSVVEGLRKVFSNSLVSFVSGMNLLREDVVVPPNVFSRDDGQPGLLGEYFANKQLEGSASLVRVDRYINLEPPPLSPASLEQPPGPNEFSVRWTGFLTPTQSAQYRFKPTAHSNRLWIDGKLVVDTFGNKPSSPKTGTVRLEKGRRYRIKLEAVSQDDGGATLTWLPLINKPIQSAVAAAQSADIVIAVVGLNSQLEGEELLVNLPGFSGGDRTTLDLPQEEEALLRELKTVGKPLIVILMNGSALSVSWAKQNANAILEAWYPGEEGGAAVAETLAGSNNPSGRLPITFYKSADQLPPFSDYSMANRTYRYFRGEPLYPFGYGLSYTHFVYNNIEVTKKDLRAGDDLVLSASVANAGNRAGDEVVQLYLKFPENGGVPLRALRSFRRIHLEPGQTKRVPFRLTSRDLSIVNEAGSRVVVPGQYTFSIGGGQPAPGTAKGTISIRGSLGLPD